MDNHEAGTMNVAVALPVSAERLQVKIFADGAELEGVRSLYNNPLIRGFTTNPTLMRKAGITDYAAFARQLLEIVPDRPISFEVFSDDFEEMGRQARLIATWGDNVYVKIPVTNTTGTTSAPLVRDLCADGIKVNVTALMTLAQVEEMVEVIKDGPASYVSVFAGRIADTGLDPVPLMRAAVRELAAGAPRAELIWASPRELLNIFQADEIGCHVITVTHDLLAKLSNVGRDLNQFSLDTVRMFHDDAAASGFTL